MYYFKTEGMWLEDKTII